MLFDTMCKFGNLVLKWKGAQVKQIDHRFRLGRDGFDPAQPEPRDLSMGKGGELGAGNKFYKERGSL